jgi:hypothetical protein
MTRKVSRSGEFMLVICDRCAAWAARLNHRDFASGSRLDAAEFDYLVTRLIEAGRGDLAEEIVGAAIEGAEAQAQAA